LTDDLLGAEAPSAGIVSTSVYVDLLRAGSPEEHQRQATG
jgi:hypothetical protein